MCLLQRFRMNWTLKRWRDFFLWYFPMRRQNTKVLYHVSSSGPNWIKVFTFLIPICLCVCFPPSFIHQNTDFILRCWRKFPRITAGSWRRAASRSSWPGWSGFTTLRSAKTGNTWWHRCWNISKYDLVWSHVPHLCAHCWRRGSSLHLLEHR